MKMNIAECSGITGDDNHCNIGKIYISSEFYEKLESIGEDSEDDS